MSYLLCSNFNMTLWKKIFYPRNFFIGYNSKTKHRAGKEWTDEPLCHNQSNSYVILQFTH